MKFIMLAAGFLLFFHSLLLSQSNIDPLVVLQKVDANMVSKTRKSKTRMIIYGKRNKRTISSRGYSQGNQKSYSEFLSPQREKGTKMLKLKNRLWIYSPSTDRTIQLSGHMLKQSIMGSDLSYEDMMEDRKLADIYKVEVITSKIVERRTTWIFLLTAKVEDVSYFKRKMWIDTTRFVPLKEDLFAKSGQLLKNITYSNYQKIGNRWYPMKINFQDMLKNGKGTDFYIDKIEFDVKIPAYVFNKGGLRK